MPHPILRKKEVEVVAKINLICEQCGGNIILDNSHEIGTCEYCFASFLIKQDKIIQNITQNITKHVYGYEGKDVEELLMDGYKLISIGDNARANEKFKRAIDIQPDCWSAWLGYASSGGDRSGYISMVPAYRKAYNDVMEELALNIDNVSDEQLEIFQSSPNNVREGIAAMKKYHLLLWRE